MSSYGWGDDPRSLWRRIDWRMWRFIVLWTVAMSAVAVVGAGR